MADCVILGRGGGSAEDLQAFNDEGVARAIAASVVPVVSAVGHETDFTIADFTADLRAPTPSAAAELVVPRLSEIKNNLIFLYDRLNKNLKNKLIYLRQALDNLAENRALAEPVSVLAEKRSNLESSEKRLNRLITLRLNNSRMDYERRVDLLESLSHKNILNRGYAYVTRGEKIVAGIDSLKQGHEIIIHFSGGSADAKITAVNANERTVADA